MVTRHIDFDRPIRLIHCNTLHHVPDEADPHAVMHAYVDALPSRSHVALCHPHKPTDDNDPAELARDSEARFMSLVGSCHYRTRNEITKSFEGRGTDRAGPDRAVQLVARRPRITSSSKEDHLLLGGVARKA